MRIRITVNGIVQGVGFRPFLHRLAEKHRISGWVKNTAFGVEIEAEGFPSDLALFQKELDLLQNDLLLKLYDILEDETPKLYVSEGLEAKDIYLVTKD